MYAYILESIKRYVSDRNIDGGLFIAGDWGTGKTFFINKYLKGFSKEELGRDLCYISLTGLEDKQDLKNRIISNSLIGNSNKWSMKSSNFLSKLKKISPFVELVSVSDLVKIDSCLYVFDDLERVSSIISHSEILQVLNYEIPKAKIIFIANENKLKIREYSEIKEKFIFKTLQFPVYYSETISSIIESTEYHEDVKSELIQNQSLIINVFEYFRFSNFRSLKFALSVINDLLGNIDFKNIVKDVIYFVLVISSLLRSDKIDQDAHHSILPYFINPKNKDRQYDKNTAVFDRDSFNKFRVNTLIVDSGYEVRYNFFIYIYEYIRTGYFQEDLIKKELNDYKEYKISISKSENEVLITNMQSYYYLSNESFIENETSILDKINSGKFSIFELTKAAGTILRIANKEITIKKYEEVKKILLFALNRTTELGYSQIIVDDEFEKKSAFIDRYLNQIYEVDSEVGDEFKKVVSRLLSMRKENKYINIDISNLENYDLTQVRDLLLNRSVESLVDIIKQHLKNRGAMDSLCSKIVILKDLKDEYHSAYVEKLRELNKAIAKIRGNYIRIDLLWINTILESTNI